MRWAVAALCVAGATTALAAPFAYVPNRGLSQVTVIDTATDAVVGAITVPPGSDPQGVAVMPDGRKLYVGSGATNVVSVANAATNAVTGSITVFGGTLGMTLHPSGTRVYGAGGSASVKIVNTASDTFGGLVLGSMAGPIQFPRLVAFTPDGAMAFVSNLTFVNNAVIDTATPAVVGQVSAGIYEGIVVTLDGTRAYGGSGLGAPSFTPSLGVIDVATLMPLPAVVVTSTPREVALHPDGLRLYVSRPDGVSIVDLATDTETLAVPVGTDNTGCDVHPDGTRVYVTDRAGVVHVLDADTLGTVATIPVGGDPVARGEFIGPIPVCGDGTLTFPEACDDGNTTGGDCCAADCTAETGAPCPDDGNECSADECDAAGACVHPPHAAGTACTADASVCTADVCDGTGACAHYVPATLGCHPLAAVKTKLTVKHLTDAAKDQVVFKWTGVGDSRPTSLGDPLATSAWTLCIGEDVGGAGTTRLESTAPAGDTCAGKPCWASKSSAYPYFAYKDKELTPAGVLGLKMKLHPSKATASFKGKGPSLGAPGAPLTLPVVARLVQSDGAACFEATYAAPKLNASGVFKATTAP